jgi:mRNA interferase RelE/StbE
MEIRDASGKRLRRFPFQRRRRSHVWKIELDAKADKDLDRLDRQVAKRILSFLYDRVAISENPRVLGEALHGPRFGKLWKYRVGDHRLVCKIEDERVVVLVLEIGHRREIYR